MNIHKSQLFWCELQGYYWFWHTATLMGLSEGHFEISSTLWLFFTALQDISAGPPNPPAEWWAPPETLGCKPPTRPARASYVASGSKGQNGRSQNFSVPRYSTVKTSKISKSGHFSCWTNTKQPIWCWPNRQLCIPSASPFALEAQRYQALEPTPQYRKGVHEHMNIPCHDIRKVSDWTKSGYPLVI